jgi:uncharacterized protein YecE (DUF72 family)
MKLWLGTSGFQYPEWKGKFYPADLSAAKMLGFYAERFSSTEINYTFRRLPSAETIRRWVGRVPAEFRFSFKAPQRVTYFAKLRGCGEIVKVFGEAIGVAMSKKGPVLFQLPATFKRDAEVLQAFLRDIPKGMRAAFEFRHDSWFDAGIFEILRKGNVALCIAENEELATPAVATADFGYLRLRREDYTPSKIRKWAKFVMEQGSAWSDAHVYFKHEERAAGPKFAQAFAAAFE